MKSFVGSKILSKYGRLVLWRGSEKQFRSERNMNPVGLSLEARHCFSVSIRVYV
jgi:hypothetical protein